MRWFGVFSLAVALGACDKAVPDEELRRLREEALAANQEAVATHTGIRERTSGRTLTLSGQLGKPEARLEWRDLEALATTHVKTINPHNPADRDKRIDYRGVRVSELLDRFEAAPAADELTFVSIDGYRSTLDVAATREFPVTLAIEADGAPIDRWHGGPIYLVFPHSDEPDTLRYGGRFWSFYVTDLIVGTEPARLRVMTRAFNAMELDALPPAELDSVVAWKVQWPATSVHLVGVRVSEVLRAAGLHPAPNDRVIVRGKSSIHRDPKAPIELAAEDLERCGFLLVTRWGQNAEAVPARLGGPIALAIPPTCADRYGERFWIPFVEELQLDAAVGRSAGAPTMEGQRAP
ncbi:MAG: molybdopterin-dependent oxidoreductase [Kofleriaceae bacterium]